MGCCKDTLAAVAHGAAQAAQHVAHGAEGLIKAALGIDAASLAAREFRRSKCRACPKAIACPPPWHHLACVCGMCGCYLPAKTANAEMFCERDPPEWFEWEPGDPPEGKLRPEHRLRKKKELEEARAKARAEMPT